MDQKILKMKISLITTQTVEIKSKISTLGSDGVSRSSSGEGRITEQDVLD